MGLLALLLVLGVAVGWGAWRLTTQRGASEAAEAAVAPEERTLREAARERTDDPEARQALGVYLLQQRRPYEAMWEFQDALDLRPAETEARRGLARALILAQLPRRALEVLAAGGGDGGTEGASKSKSKSKSGGGEEVEDRRVAAAAYLAMGDALGAVTVLEAAGLVLESSAAGLLDLGNAYEALGDDQAAGSAYQRHLRQEPGSLEGQLALARVAAREGLWNEALSALTRARQIAPRDPRPVVQLGRALLARDGQGVQAFGRSGVQGIRSFAAKARKGRKRETDWEGNKDSPVFLELSRFRSFRVFAARRTPSTPERLDGAQVLQRVLEANPEYGPAHLHMGLWRLRHGQAEQAAWHLERAAARQAGGEETRLRLAGALEAAGRKADAAYHRGLYFQATQQLHRAIGEFQRVAALDPDRKDVSLLLSAAYRQIERDDRAREVARQGAERHLDDPELQARYAQLLIMSGDRTGGSKLCREWIERQPDAAEPYRLLARIALDALRPAEAARLLEQAIERAPENAEYHRELARALMAQPTPTDLRRAAAALRRAVALDPRDAESCLRLGEVLERLGDLEGALGQYQRSMDRDRSVRYGAYSLSQLCPKLGKAERRGFYAENVRVLREREDAARLLWRQVYQSPEEADAHARLARLLLAAGDLWQARYQLEQVVRLRPDRKEERRQLQVLERLLSMREG